MIRGTLFGVLIASTCHAMASSNGMLVPNGSVLPTSDRSKSAYTFHAPNLRTDLAAQGLRFGAPIYVQIFKDPRELDLYVEGPEGFELFRSFWICEMSGTLGPKRWRGDYQAPEGFYSVSADLMNPNSSFHLSFNIGYPNEYDSSKDRTGSLIMVHGGCASRGCFAMTNRNMEKIYTLAEAALLSGQEEFQVHVFPFRMTAEKMHLHRFSRWRSFWENLKEGYDYFLEHRRPPEVRSENGRYLFE